MGALVWILTLSLVILIHETGHFVAMRLSKVPVDEFSLGFGPAIWQRKAASGVTYSLRMVLLGGYVRTNKDYEMLHERIGWLKRLFVYSGGMIANCLAATATMLLMGRGLTASVAFPFVNWLMTPYMVFHMLFSAPQTLAQGVMGPVGIVHMGASQAMSLTEWARLFVGIHVGVAGFNLLPIPALDGGRILMIPFEKLLGRKGITILVALSGVLLLCLFLAITFKDVTKIFAPH